MCEQQYSQYYSQYRRASNELICASEVSSIHFMNTTTLL